MKKYATLLTLGLCLVALGARAQQNTMDEPWEKNIRITQGPAVIEDTGRAATLTWTTDRPSANHVRYRVGDGEWKSVYQPGGSVQHSVRLTELEPGRRVEWQVLTRDGDIRTSGNFRAREEEVRDHPGRGGRYGRHVPVYRADNPQTGQHLYTTQRQEIESVERSGWRSAGTVGYIATSPAGGHVAVYRVYVSNGDHFYTTSAEERDTVLRQGAQDVGVVGYIASSPRPGTYALHRLVSTKNGYHFYSANDREVREATRHQGYRDEGVMGYIWLE